MGFNQLIQQINEISEENQRDRGTYFEYLVQAYLKNEPTYKNEFTNVWMLHEVPEEKDVPKADLGVDLVAEKTNGDLVAIQAKFYSGRIQRANIDSFLSQLGEKWVTSHEGIIVASTDDWGRNAEQALQNREDVSRIGLSDLRNSKIDWDQFSFGDPKKVVVTPPKKLRKYQIEVIEAALDYYKTHDRGQLIMAPGTGKTFTSLKIAETLAKESDKEQFVVLYLVPSIQLLTQTLRGWNNDAELTISSMAVTSDRNASRGTIDQEESNLHTRASDIGYAATTSPEKVVENYRELSTKAKKDMLVVFGTYQSIDVLKSAQENGFPEIDLIIADEAHRTTGATALGDEDSSFVKVHSNLNINGVKRLYQTATPKLYGADAQRRAEENSIVISSMDDVDKYGEVFYRLGFGDAITQDILTDYKLMVLAVDETVVQKDMQRSLSDAENGLNIDDIGRIIGVWNGMVKRETFSDKVSGEPMKRAIAFSRTINDSKRLADQFENVVNDYLESEDGYQAEVRHVDGTMNALIKNDALDWLASEDIPENSARILSNVRFLTEGIDVPNLDAIIFLSPRKSQVDIVQAVGRIIRKSPDKEYGYIILPIVIPAGETAETILDNNRTYDVVWQVLNALRSVDERFEATVNKLQLNKKKPENINVIGVGKAPDDPTFSTGNSTVNDSSSAYQTALDLDWEAVEGAIYGKIVQKVGDRKYLEDWSQDVAKIAQRHMNYINIIIEGNLEASEEFNKFVNSLRHNINETISHNQAVEMLAQHLITLPIFEALFDKYSFVRNNPVGLAMEKIIEEFSKYGFEKEQQELAPFYESVKLRASGIDNAEAKQKIIITLYDKFFSTGFKETTERLGIVFTPVEVVDFIIKSVDDVLKKHFGKGIASDNVHILDPFTGTGTFIVRTLNLLKEQLDEKKISLADLTLKYTQELHANEIVLLSYYIAAINIEATFDEISGSGTYEPFEGIVLTDTFESTETEDTLDDDFFGSNDSRLKRQQSTRITAIIGNPPYSIGQGDANDDNQNISYPKLEASIQNTYARNTRSALSRSLYDTYIKAFRWATDRIDDNGVVAFVSNGSFIDSTSTDGFRATLYQDYNYIYVYNLRGDQRTVGEKSRKEGGKIFGSGSRTPIAITVLVKDGSDNHEIYYHDIGDYLNRDQKLSIIKTRGSIEGVEWELITPDSNNDWINQRDADYESFIPMDGGFFADKAIGVSTNRDEWVYGFNLNHLKEKAKRLVENYNHEVKKTSRLSNSSEKLAAINLDPSFVKWTRGMKNNLTRGKIISNPKNFVKSMYRPFNKKWLAYDNDIIEMPGRFKDIFGENNSVICVTGRGASREFSAFITDCIPNLDLMEKGQGFYFYNNGDSQSLLDNDSNILESIQVQLDLDSEEVFYYVYGILHSKEYKLSYINELRKDLPRIPIVENKNVFVHIGRKLAELHLNYESIGSHPDVSIEMTDNPSFKVKKMRALSRADKTTIIFNEDIKVRNIPEKAYEYIVNGKPAIQWIMEQYKVPTSSRSGNIDDPNTYSTNPRYILDLLLSVINVSVQTVELVDSLPPLEVVSIEEN